MLSIQLGNRDISYSIRVSRRAKRLGIRVSENGVEVVLPRPGAAKHAVPFLRLHAAWVLKHLDRFERLAARRKHLLLPKNSFLLRGKETRVEIESASIENSSIVLDEVESVLRICAGPGESPQEKLHDWLFSLSEGEIVNRLRARAAEMNLQPAKIAIRDQKSCWGSCSPKGNLSFNGRLIMAPPEVLDYVVVHELAHLAELSHGKRFWRIVEAYCPGHRLCRRWLRDYRDLMIEPSLEITQTPDRF